MGSSLTVAVKLGLPPIIDGNGACDRHIRHGETVGDQQRAWAELRLGLQPEARHRCRRQKGIDNVEQAQRLPPEVAAPYAAVVETDSGKPGPKPRQGRV